MAAVSPQKVGGIHAEILDEIVFLHIRGAEGLIKIVENTDGRLDISVPPFMLFFLLYHKWAGKSKGKGRIFVGDEKIAPPRWGEGGIMRGSRVW